MPPVKGSSFAPQAACPDQQALAAYHADTLTYLMRERVGVHLRVCDFCGAASQLLAQLPPQEASPEAVEMPLALRLLAQTLLSPQSRADESRRSRVA